jgi:hypothetical protein
MWNRKEDREVEEEDERRAEWIIDERMDERSEINLMKRVTELERYRQSKRAVAFCQEVGPILERHTQSLNVMDCGIFLLDVVLIFMNMILGTTTKYLGKTVASDVLRSFSHDVVRNGELFLDSLDENGVKK